MTVEEIAKANNETLEQFFARCYRWKSGKNYASPNEIRTDVRVLEESKVIPLYVAEYLALFTKPAQYELWFGN